MKQVMYFGPTIPGLIKQNTVFKDEIPERIAKRAEEDKSFSRLLVLDCTLCMERRVNEKQI